MSAFTSAWQLWNKNLVSQGLFDAVPLSVKSLLDPEALQTCSYAIPVTEFQLLPPMCSLNPMLQSSKQASTSDATASKFSTADSVPAVSAVAFLTAYSDINAFNASEKARVSEPHLRCCVLPFCLMPCQSNGQICGHGCFKLPLFVFLQDQSAGCIGKKLVCLRPKLSFAHDRLGLQLEKQSWTTLG